jgi:hypothetical protein
MVDYIPYQSNMHHDFELYSNNHEQPMDFPLTHQPYLPASTYNMEQTFSAPFDPMMPLAEVQRPHELQYHYDAIAQGVQFHTPAGSPHSTSHSFHEQPPVLSASSESGASVSSSAMGSPTHYSDSWNPMGLGLTSSFEYPGMTASEKTFVGESSVSFTVSSSTSSIVSPTTPIFKTPVTPASANWSSIRSSGRRNSLLSHVVRSCDVTPASCSHPVDSSFSLSQSSNSFSRFPCVIPIL